MWIIGEGIFLLSLLGIDLFSKWAMKAFILATPTNYFSALDGVLGFTYVENDGASFGIFSGNKWLLLGITIATSALILIFLIAKPKAPKLLRYGLLTVFAGAIGNVVDRAALGYVRDFIDYTFLKTWFNIDFAIGNIADIFCIVGVMMIIFYMIFGFKEGDLARKPKLAKGIK